MMSPTDRLAYMANQIARNLAVQGEAAAARAVAEHIAAFWDPRMKVQLFAMDEASFDPIAARAIGLLHDLTGRPAASATTFASTETGGGSDAG